jgi:hypothetical protein
MYAKSIGSTSASITGPKTPINQPDDESGSSRRGRFNASFPPMTRSPTFSPAVENTTPPRTSGPVSPKAEPTWADVTGLAMANNHAYRRASLNPSRFPSICTCQVDGAQAGLAAALPGGRADRSCERLPSLASTTGGGRPERRSAIEVTPRSGSRSRNTSSQPSAASQSRIAFASASLTLEWLMNRRATVSPRQSCEDALVSPLTIDAGQSLRNYAAVGMRPAPDEELFVCTSSANRAHYPNRYRGEHRRDRLADVTRLADQAHLRGFSAAAENWRSQ